MQADGFVDHLFASACMSCLLLCVCPICVCVVCALDTTWGGSQRYHLASRKIHGPRVRGGVLGVLGAFVGSLSGANAGSGEHFLCS